ncbi:TonB-dependent receptor [Geomonas limicola]|uniref:TonB-dependent receptor n=1 Tax=Geomonas limicola TaxID=2740186 RepID=A0A6V8N1U2_9BACT|nr:TonB-dependent receptor [Geomonas limicola]GFO66468.1 TonB-dependent receptor [Geomonas limicola]
MNSPPFRLALAPRWLAAATLLVLACGCVEPPALHAEPASPAASDQEYLDLGLEDLMNLTVTSVARKSQRLSDAAAAVFVITQEDIRRSGVTNIADALRMVPGLDVARIDANKWAVSSRGSNGRFASKMLVLFDGRTVYTPLFSGVFWDRQDTVLEDIERIEVIRGPGAALWGANAVNGVINIITRPAWDSTGTLVSAGAGSSERGFAELRYGSQLSAQSALRVYAKYLSRAAQDDLTGHDANNGMSAIRGGFRLDSEPNQQNSFTVQGDIYNERLHDSYVRMVPGLDTLLHTTPVLGLNLLSRFKHSFSEQADFELQLYYDRTDTDLGVIKEERDTFDLDFQNRLAGFGPQEFVWGGGFRFSHDQLANQVPALTLSPTGEDTHLASLFVQDDITVWRDRAHLILGTKLEHNSYTGWEVQPNARVIYTPNRQHTIWGAVSRAVRTPSRGEDSLSLYQPGPVPGLLIHLQGNSELKAEELLAYELGYRVEPAPVLSADLALFYNRYRRLSVFQPGQVPQGTPFGPQVALPLTLGNFGHAETAGAELSVDYRMVPWWRLRGAYSYLGYLRSGADQGAQLGSLRGSSPRHLVSLRSSQDLTSEVELDLWLRYLTSLSFTDTSNGAPVGIPAYLTLDCRLAWKPVNGFEVALIGQNLLERQHQEFDSQELATQATRVPRGVYGKLTWQF